MIRRLFVMTTLLIFAFVDAQTDCVHSDGLTPTNLDCKCGGDEHTCSSGGQPYCLTDTNSNGICLDQPLCAKTDGTTAINVACVCTEPKKLVGGTMGTPITCNVGQICNRTTLEDEGVPQYDFTCIYPRCDKNKGLFQNTVPRCACGTGTYEDDSKTHQIPLSMCGTDTSDGTYCLETLTENGERKGVCLPTPLCVQTAGDVATDVECTCGEDVSKIKTEMDKPWITNGIDAWCPSGIEVDAYGHRTCDGGSAEEFYAPTCATGERCLKIPFLGVVPDGPGRRFLPSEDSISVQDGQHVKDARFACLKPTCSNTAGKSVNSESCQCGGKECRKGEFCNAANNMCSNSATTANNDVYKCPSGMYQNTSEQFVSPCKTCPFPTASMPGASECKYDENSCPAGTFFAIDGFGMLICDGCEKGKYSNVVGLKSENNNKDDKPCTSCDTGKYADETARTDCTSCEPGRFAAGDTKGGETELTPDLPCTIW